ncbi:MAG: PAS domain S-box protein [Candidatus Methanoperedens sp.]
MESKEYNYSDELLIVEDSPTQARMLKFLLEKHNYRVNVACNGREALDLLNIHKPMIVISDIIMPEMDGYQLCKYIKSDENLKKIPVILLTSLSDPGEVLKGMECGADNFMTKPYDEQLLISRLKSLILRKQMHESESVQNDVEILFGGQKYFITAKRQQILDFLFSTYETAVWKNSELLRVQEELKELNERLEEKIDERTAALKTEIKQRKQSEEKLQESEERLKSIFDNANDAIITTDIEGNVISWNKAAEKLFGFTEDEVKGKELSSLIVPENVMKERHKIIYQVLSGNTFAGVETIRKHKDGTKICVSVNISPIHDADKKVVGLSGIIRDITEHKKLEKLRIENEHLAAVNKTKSNFLSQMSHELRTPLNAIIGFSELITLGLAGEINEKQKRYTKNIHESGNHLLGIINDILDLTKVESGKLDISIEKIPVAQIINETFMLLNERALECNVILRKELDPELEFIEADKLRFKQILFNLLGNAVKFSKPGGGTVTITVKKESDMAKFSISDTGIGIREEDMEKLFNEFEQIESGSSRKYGGTGLGLAITKQLVELHGGRIWAESRYGEGSTFMFTLPTEAKTMGDTK